MEFILKYADPKDFHIHFFGTEPLLSKEKLYTALKWIEGFAPHWRRGITSNMTLMTYPTANMLRRYKVDVLASLDGMEQSHNRFRVFRNGRGTWERTVMGIQAFSHYSKKFGIAMTLTPENVPHMLEMYNSPTHLNHGLLH